MKMALYCFIKQTMISPPTVYQIIKKQIKKKKNFFF